MLEHDLSKNFFLVGDGDIQSSSVLDVCENLSHLRILRVQIAVITQREIFVIRAALKKL
jgi:hypothetical protein